MGCDKEVPGSSKLMCWIASIKEQQFICLQWSEGSPLQGLPSPKKGLYDI